MPNYMEKIEWPKYMEHRRKVTN